MSDAGASRKVVGLGVACLDQLLRWQDMRAPVLGNQILGSDTQGGGMAATALVTVTRLGGQAEFWGAVADDWIGDLIVKGLQDERVDTSQVRRVPGRRGPMMIVCIDGPTGERHFQHWTGLCETDRPIGDLDRLRGAGGLLTDLSRPESDLRAAREARRLGIPVVADVEKLFDHARDVLRYVDYAIACEECARDLAGTDDDRAACEALRATGPRCAVVTLGPRGLVFLDGDRFGRMPAFEVDVVDTTGAGDVFHGAFCWGLVQGMPLPKNLRQASAAAAMKCRRIGGRAGIPTRDEVVRFLAERDRDAS